MIVRWVLSEMVDEGILLCSQGLGMFVFDYCFMSLMLEIKSICDEIEYCGYCYVNCIVLLEVCRVDYNIVMYLVVNEGDEVFCSVIVYCENDLLVQYEDCWVNLYWVFEYL